MQINSKYIKLFKLCWISKFIISITDTIQILQGEYGGLAVKCQASKRVGLESH